MYLGKLPSHARFTIRERNSTYFAHYYEIVLRVLQDTILYYQQQIFSLTIIISRDSSVDMATGYRLGQLKCRSSSPGRVKNFLFSMSSRPFPLLILQAQVIFLFTFLKSTGKIEYLCT
jgi:hypothetical protein